MHGLPHLDKTSGCHVIKPFLLNFVATAPRCFLRNDAQAIHVNANPLPPTLGLAQSIGDRSCQWKQNLRKCFNGPRTSLMVTLGFSSMALIGYGTFYHLYRSYAASRSIEIVVNYSEGLAMVYMGLFAFIGFAFLTILSYHNKPDNTLPT